MSGFLSNLVTKSLSPTTVVRPRLLSLFEPASELAPHLPMAATSREHDGAHTLDQDESVETEAASAPSHATFTAEHISQQTRSQDTGTAAVAGAPELAQGLRSPVVSQQAAQTGGPVQHESRPQAALPDPTPSFEPAQDLRSPVVSQQAAQTGDLVQRESRPQAALPDPTLSPVPALIEHTVERVVVERVATLPEQLAAAQHLPQAFQRRSTLQPRHELVGTSSPVTPPETDNDAMKLITQEQMNIILSTSATPGQSVRMIERLHIAESASTVPFQAKEPAEPTPSATVVQPLVTRYVEPLRQPIATDAPPPAPTVQVTIGRIEVRATQQPSQTTRTRHVPTRLSLDEYLRQRSRGSGG